MHRYNITTIDLSMLDWFSPLRYGTSRKECVSIQQEISCLLFFLSHPFLIVHTYLLVYKTAPFICGAPLILGNYKHQMKYMLLPP
jgi:hypothetical protein